MIGILPQRRWCVSAYAIAKKKLNAEGTRTRYGCEFKTQTIVNILERVTVAHG